MDSINNSELTAQRLSLYQLLKRFDKVEIPLIQRDYAHGRIKNEKENYDSKELDDVLLIRDSLIDALFNAVEGTNDLLLNFIYGKHIEREKTREHVFIPIDGQQRLTTMYLFHWYIFKKTNNTEGINELRKFSYATRSTSRSFCEYLCSEGFTVDFRASLDEQIRNCTWFSGSYENDPTIKSMIVVLKTIQNKLYSIDDAKFESYKNKLVEWPACPIQFLWLDIENIGNEDDLYIKMNARGKQLSDFEVFKAAFEYSDLLSDVIESSDIDRKVSFISKFNNEYTDLLYSYLGKGADDAIMIFLREMLRDGYLVSASKNGIRQKVYRDYYAPITQMNGKLFFCFADNKDYFKLHENLPTAYNYRDSNINSIRLTKEILDRLYSYKIAHNQIRVNRPDTYLQDYFDEEKIFIKYLDPNSETKFRQDFVQYCLCIFIARFNFPENDDQVLAYYSWKRLVNNIANNADLGTAETVVEVMSIMNSFLDTISEYAETSIFNAVQNFENNPLLTGKNFLRPQFEEEILKANLIIDNNEWKAPIYDAEFYFSSGDIRFLLEFSRLETGNYDIESFQCYTEKLKAFLSPNKQLQDQSLKFKFEKALLCQKDDTRSQMSHLTKLDNSRAYSFCLKGFDKLLGNSSDFDEQLAKWDIFRRLVDQISVTDIEESLNTVIANGIENLDGWKKVFVMEDLYDVDMGKGTIFSNSIYIAKDKTILLLTKNSERSISGELNTVRLYKELKEKYSVDLQLEATGEVLDSLGKPRRYLLYKNFSIGFSMINNCYQYWSNADPSVRNFISKDEVLAFISTT